jgi:hypothetical protein
VIVGAVLHSVVIALHVFANKEELNAIFVLIPSFIVGISVMGIKRGFLFGFLFTLVFAVIGALILQPEMFGATTDPNVAASVAILFIIYSAIGGALSDVGGSIGGRIFKK